MHLSSRQLDPLQHTQERIMTLRPIGQCALAITLVSFAAIARSGNGLDDSKPFYSTHPLVSDGARPADHVDASLKNAWGVAFNPTGVVWVANNRTNISTLYDGTGTKVPLGSFPEVQLPLGTRGPAGPTGIVFNGSRDFVINQGGGLAAASAFIFAGENGTL